MIITYSKQAAKAISRMDTAAKQRIKAAIEKLPAGDVKKLSGYSYAYRLRVGDWRILFDMSDDIKINDILPRGDAYKK
jgi:mRNA-degrading endonuclease RelE of RelBE toxin-antitoxin system